MSSSPPANSPQKGLQRYLLIALGVFFVVLAFVGVFLPILPTTPFLLLASFFFIRSSPYLNEKLRRSRLFGPFIRDWQEKRGVRLSVKYTAITTIPIVIAASAYFGQAYFGQLTWPFVLLLVVLGGIGLIVVIRLPVISDDDD